MSALRIVAYVAVLVALGATLSVAAAGAGAGADTDEPIPDAVVVDLDEEGDAVVTVTIPFDLTVEDEQTDFEAFVASDTEQQAQLDSYESRLSNVAAEMESQTGRQMSVTAQSVSTQTRNNGELGLVVLTATWDGLAVNDGSQLVLGPPFDSGFGPDRTIAVRPPDGHQVVSTTPTPASNSEPLLWNGDQSLDEFEVVVELQNIDSPDDGSNDDTTGDGSGDDTTGDGSGDDTTGGGEPAATSNDASGPGFGILAVLLGIVGLRVLAGRR